MPRKKEDLEKVTLNLFPGDFERLRLLYPQIGAGKAMRHIVRNHLNLMEAQIKTPTPRIRLEDLDV